MKLELHILQNFAPSSLNRDDTGSPKDCELGGVRRARISSQCYKRAIREAFTEHQLLDDGERATRTKRLVDAVADPVAKLKNVELDVATRAVVRALGGAGLKAHEKEAWKTEYLLFIPTRVIPALVALVGDNLATLAPAVASATEQPKAEPATKAKPAKSKKQEKAEAKDDVPVEVRKRVEELLKDGSRTPELGLFGRMIADAPGWNVDAACQVAHAISTHRVSMEFDFFTGIDELKREAGSDMMGTIPFNSACFYRYLVVDVDDLTRNLGGDPAAREQAKKTLTALLRAAVLAIPSGKQNSMAAHNLPSFILTDVRDRGAPRSLANAFVDPVRPTRGDHADLLTQSVVRLGKQLKSLDDVYSAEGRKDLSYCVVDPDDSLAKGFGAAAAHATRRESLDALVKAATAAAFGGTA